MYQKHWGLKESPFCGCLNPEFFYESPTHEEAIARLHYLVDQQRRVGLLVGPSGSGKSLLLEVFAQQLRRSGRSVAQLSLMGLDANELLWQLATAWGLHPEPTASVGELWRGITDRLTEHRYQQLDTVALFDDAEQADWRVLTQVTRLARWDWSPEMHLTLILAGQPEGVNGMDAHLLDLVEFRIEVEPWGPSDTQGFLTTSLAHAGRESPLFAAAAIERLHELAHGIPRRVSQLADLALLAGAGQNLQQIDASVVESVYQELDTVGHADMPTGV
jgi:type II secretory pathway predicted ATPase ExeA